MSWEQFEKEFKPWGIQIPKEVGTIRINTREGEVKAKPGDYIMVDTEGHLYPIAKSELENAYSKVS